MLKSGLGVVALYGYSVSSDSILAYTIPFTSITFFDIIVFIVSLIIGVYVVKILCRIIEKMLEKAKTPPLVSGLVVSLIKAIGYIIVVLSVLPIIGIDTSTVGLGLSAILAFILGFGLQDTWSNMAAGIWLSVIKPFDIGDYIEAAGYSGIVERIGIMSTLLRTFDNVVINIPNKNIWGSPIVNYTRKDTRRIDLTIGVGYNTDLDKAITLLLDIAKNHERILNDPEPQVVVTELADSSINLQLRAWVKTSDYGGTRAELLKKIYEEFVRNNIEIPYPQLDIHIRDMPK
jgi:small conductance mechanosensitive channel